MKLGKLVNQLNRQSKPKLRYPANCSNREFNRMFKLTENHPLFIKKSERFFSHYKFTLNTHNNWFWSIITKLQTMKLDPKDRFAALETVWDLKIIEVIDYLIKVTKNKKSLKELNNIKYELVIKDILE